MFEDFMHSAIWVETISERKQDENANAPSLGWGDPSGVHKFAGQKTSMTRGEYEGMLRFAVPGNPSVV